MGIADQGTGMCQSIVDVPRLGSLPLSSRVNLDRENFPCRVGEIEDWSSNRDISQSLFSKWSGLMEKD